MATFLTIFRRFFKSCPKARQTFQNIFQITKKLPKMSEENRIFPRKNRSSFHQTAKHLSTHSRPQRQRSFWSAPRIATSGPVQRHFGVEWLCKHNRLRPEPIRFDRLDSKHAQSDGKSVNRGLLVLDLARGRDSWC